MTSGGTDKMRSKKELPSSKILIKKINRFVENRGLSSKQSMLTKDNLNSPKSTNISNSYFPTETKTIIKFTPRTQLKSSKLCINKESIRVGPRPTTQGSRILNKPYSNSDFDNQSNNYSGTASKLKITQETYQNSEYTALRKDTSTKAIN